MTLEELLSPVARDRLPLYRQRFANAKPFRHAVIDAFFHDDVLRWLVEDFPPFRGDKARNEMGRVGSKAVWDDLPALSPRYARIYEGLSSPALRAWFSELTGIPDLLHDDQMYGGGTHENLDGAELDAHVDFNFDERLGWHRRLNVLVFLNPEWEDAWGGRVELHSEPRDPERDEILRYSPILNRCVVFETNEVSWHGFDQIRLPAGKKHLSRRSLTLYFYTRERPAEEIAPSHATVYVQGPLPERFREGYTLDWDDVRDLRRLLHKRDGFLRCYQNRELADSARYEALLAYHRQIADAVRLPLRGYVAQEGPAEGHWPDGWLRRECRFTVTAERPVAGVALEAFAPAEFAYPVEVALAGPGAREAREIPEPGSIRVELPLSLEAGARAELRVSCSGAVPEGGDDARERALHLTRLVFEHETGG